MIIRQLILKSFGKFQDTTIDLKDGVNVIYGENEAGKTTLHRFIEAMFYGFYKPNIKNKKLNDEYDKFFPWTNSKEFSGAMILEDEKEIRIERSFMKNADDLVIYDNRTGENITESYPYDAVLRMHQPSLKHLGFPITTYQNTVSISQMKSRTSKELVHEIKDSMINLKETGTLELSVKNILKILADKRTAIGTERSKKSNYGRAKDRILELEDEKTEAMGASKELESLLFEEINFLREIKKVEEEKQGIEAEISRRTKQEARENALKIESLKNEIEELNRFYSQSHKERKGRRRFLAFCMVGITLFLLGWKIMKPLLIPWSLIFLTALGSLITFFIMKKKDEDKLKVKIEEEKAFLQKTDEDLRDRSYRELELELEHQLENKNQSLIQFHSKRSAVKTEIENKRRAASRLVEIEEELEAKNRELKEMEFNLKTFDVVEEALLAVSKDIQDDYAPRLIDEVSKIIQQTTQNKYKEVKVSPSLGISVVDQSLDKLVHAEDLSAGTVDLMYFALRLGLSEITSMNKKLPIILDDSFVQYDEKRCFKIFEFLLKLDRQILLFTCHKREVELLEKLSKKINIIEL